MVVVTSYVFDWKLLSMANLTGYFDIGISFLVFYFRKRINIFQGNTFFEKTGITKVFLVIWNTF